MTAPAENRIEVGAPIDVEVGGATVSGVALSTELNLDSRTRKRVEVGPAPSAAASRFAEFLRREAARAKLIPASAVVLTGSDSVLSEWESPTIPGYLNGDKIKDFPGSAFLPESIDPDSIGDREITSDMIADESIGLDELSDALKAFIRASGGTGGGGVGFQNLPPGLQSLYCKLERYPAPELIFAADPSPDAFLGNLVEDPEFTGPGGAWSLGEGWSIGTIAEEPVAVFEAGSPGSSGTLSQGLDLGEDYLYRVSYRVIGQAAGSVRAILGGTQGFLRSFDDEWSEYIVAGAGSSIEFVGTADSEGAFLAIDDVKVQQVARTAGIAPRLSDEDYHYAARRSDGALDIDVDGAVWEFEHYNRWTFDRALGLATYAGPSGQVSRVRFIIPADQIRPPAVPQVYSSEMALGFEFRILEIVNPFRHGNFTTVGQKEFSTWPGGVSVQVPGDLRSRAFGDGNPVGNRSQWFFKTGKFSGLTFFDQPQRFRKGDAVPSLGFNVIINGGFGSEVAGGGVTGWTVEGNGWRFNRTELPAGPLGHALFESGINGQRFFGYLRQGIELESGSTYQLIYDVVSNTGNVSIRPELGGTIGLSRQNAGRFTETMVAGGGGYLRFQGAIVGLSPIGSAIVDNIELRKLVFPNAEGDRYVIDLWIAASGVTISNPRFSLVGRRPDPEYRSKATRETPAGEWTPVVAVES